MCGFGALQFELMLRKKDCVVEWFPESEPGDTDVHYRGEKWMRGLRWEEIDESLILRHLAPMIIEEFERMAAGFVTEGGFDRSVLPARGPIVKNEINAMQWSANEFRRK